MTTQANEYGSISKHIDELLRTLPPGTTVSREYIKQVVSQYVEYGSLHRGVMSRQTRGFKKKSKSSRGSRLTSKIVKRLKVLADRGVIQLVGTTHVLVIDMDK